MPSVDQIRHTITAALAKEGIGPVTLALELGKGRDYLRDFLEGKKDSLKIEVVIALSERWDIPIKNLVPSEEKALRRSA
jgi:hypothetical protein